MTLILNDVFPLFNDIVRSSSENSDLEKKMRAVNEGNRALLDRISLLGKPPQELLSVPTNLTTTISLNYANLPSDFYMINDVWRRDDTSTDYIRLPKESNISYDKLKELKGSSFFDTDDTDIVSTYSILGNTKIYFDRYFSATESNRIKIDYYARHPEVVAYDKLTMTSVVGTFQADEDISGGTSGATATIKTVNPTTLYLYPEDTIGILASGETITGDLSGATATISGSIVEKAQELLWSANRKTELMTAWGAMYLYLIGSSESAEKSQTLDTFLSMHSNLDTKETFKFGISK